MQMLLYVIFIGCVLFFIVAISIEWITHIIQVKNCRNKYGWAGYSIFKKEFRKYKWDYSDIFMGLVSYKDGCLCHSYIVEFGNIGMIMRTPIDYFLVQIFIRKYIKKNFSKPKEIHHW